MDDVDIIEALVERFRHNPFRVHDMPDDMVDAFSEWLGIGHYNSIGKRTAIGKWLAERNEAEFRLSDHRAVRLVELEHATDSEAGLHLIEVVGIGQ